METGYTPNPLFLPPLWKIPYNKSFLNWILPLWCNIFSNIIKKVNYLQILNINFIDEKLNPILDGLLIPTDRRERGTFFYWLILVILNWELVALNYNDIWSCAEILKFRKGKTPATFSKAAAKTKWSALYYSDWSQNDRNINCK